MADNLPVNFPIPGAKALANYNYSDVADGTGVNLFYPAMSINNAGEVPVLINFVAGAVIASGGTIVLNGRFVGNDIDFDLTPFNSPRVVMGTAYLSGYADYDSAAGIYLKAQVRKVSGVTETNISSEITTDSRTADGVVLIAIPLTQTEFAVGDFLRLTLSKGGGNGGFICDPTQTIQTKETLKFRCPFKLTDL